MHQCRERPEKVPAREVCNPIAIYLQIEYMHCFVVTAREPNLIYTPGYFRSSIRSNPVCAQMISALAFEPFFNSYKRPSPIIKVLHIFPDRFCSQTSKEVLCSGRIPWRTLKSQYERTP